MKILVVAMAMAVLAGCSKDDHRTTPGDIAGRTAYYAEKGTKKAAKEVGHDLKTFSHDAQQGFEDAERKDLERKKAKERERQ